jgi:tripartite-type tricarboxylate transporter receptor subunit TctC
MNPRQRIWNLVWPCVVALACAAVPAVAQEYPTRPVRAIVPFPPGGGTDIAARLIANKLVQLWGKQIIIDNRAGANGNIAAEIAAKALPDGYTLLFGAAGPLAINPTLYGKVGFDPIRDFAGIAMVAPVYYILVANPGVPAKNISEFLQLARTPNNRIVLASAGIGSPGHLSGEMLKMLAGVDFIHAPFKGGGPALAAVLSGEGTFVFADVIAGMSLVKAGRLKLFATAGPRRIPQLPDVPTLAESGVKGYSAISWTALFAPAGTPAPIIRKVNADMKDVLKLPDVQEQLASDGSEFGANTPEYTSAFLKSEVAKWAKVIKQSGAKPE